MCRGSETDRYLLAWVKMLVWLMGVVLASGDDRDQDAASFDVPSQQAEGEP
jgi:hypothetical protein